MCPTVRLPAACGCNAKNGHTCVKWPLKGGFLQVWQRKPVFWPFLEPYLQGIGATTLVVAGMAAKGRRG